MMQFTYATLSLSVPQDKLGGKRRPLFLRRNIRNKANQVDGATTAASTIGPNGMIGPDAPPTTTTTSATTTTTTLGVGIKEENSGSTATATATTKAEENKTNQEDSGNTGAAAVQPSIAATTPTTTTTSTIRSDYQIVDNTEVKLNMNSYKMVWVTNKHGLFYKRNSISKARKVSANDDDDDDNNE